MDLARTRRSPRSLLGPTWPGCAHGALALALCTSLAAVAPARATFYEWVDKNGVVHLDDLPPAEAQRVYGVEGPAGGRVRVSISAPAQERSDGKGHAKRARGTQRALDWWERSNDAPPDEIDRAAGLYNIPAELIRAVIAVESDGNAAALSHKGAVGLMQLMPETAGRMFVEDPVDPAQNIQGGTRYLRTLANEFRGDMLLVLAAYNAGPEAVRKHKGVPPFDETRAYVRRVMMKFTEYKLQTARRRGAQLAHNERRQEGGVDRP
jgi:hypothetical protein